MCTYFVNLFFEKGGCRVGKIDYTIFVRTKDERINFRISPKTKIELEAAAELRGTSMSGLIHQLIVRAIRDERAADPKAFNAAVQRIEEFKAITSQDEVTMETLAVFEEVKQ